MFRCDARWFPQSLSLEARLAGDRWSGVLRSPHRQVDLAELRSIWYRSPTVFDLPAGMSRVERQHAEREAKLGLGGVLGALPVLWVNHPGAEADAAYKPRQLATARACGLTVPRTLITNDPAAARRFAAESGPVVTKLLGANVIDEDQTRKVARTRLLSAEDLSDLRGVEVTAHLVQEWVDKEFEVRVVAVGEDLFASAIHAHSPAARIDWRADYESLTYDKIDVPPTVASGVRAYLAAVCLRYAAFDFVVTPAGAWVFLEANPGGQFGWLEGATGLPISIALAALLTQGIP